MEDAREGGPLYKGVESRCGLRPVYRVPVSQLFSQAILALSLVFNIGANISLNQNREGTNMVKDTEKPYVASQSVKNDKTTGLGCGGRLVRESG